MHDRLLRSGLAPDVVEFFPKTGTTETGERFVSSTPTEILAILNGSKRGRY